MVGNILLTGPPGCGKTTVLRRLIELLPPDAVGGFLTEEIRAGRMRVGFKARAIGGAIVTLAHVGGTGGCRVGRYRVNVEEFERVILKALAAALRDPQVRYLVVDEIGKMEFLAPSFAECIFACLEDPRPLVATIMERNHPVADRIKGRPDVEVITVTAANRERLPEWLAARLRDR